MSPRIDRLPPVANLPLGGVVWIGGFFAVVATGASNGGYFPVSWGWIALGLLWLTALETVAKRDTWTAKGFPLVGAFLLYVCFVFVSSRWDSASGREVERDALLVIAAWLVLVSVRPTRMGHCLGALAAAICALGTYALTARLFPERLGRFDYLASYRLAAPVGYWNGLGILCDVGIILLFGFLCARSPRFSSAFRGGLVPVTVALCFTYSRGARIALAFGIGAAHIFGSRRGHVLVAGVVASIVPVSGVMDASRSLTFTRQTSNAADAVRDGHRLALVVAALSRVSACVGYAFMRVELRFAPARASTGHAQRDALATQLNPLSPNILSPNIAELKRELATQGSIGVVRK